jgi:FkbM family methyltransferase
MKRRGPQAIVMKQGESSHYRQRTLEERLVERAATMLPNRVRRAMSGVYNLALRRRAAHLECRLPGGESIRILPEHRHIAWNPDEYAAFRYDIRPGDVVFDIGANLGAYTLVFGQWVGAGGRVFSFEPAPDARRGLARHVDINGLIERVVVRAEAVSGSEGTAQFLASGTSGANRLTPETAAESCSVPTTTIDALCTSLGVRPRLIKVDVEGAELDVLRGARQTIAAAGDGLRLYVEMHPTIWPALGITREHIEAELKAQHLRAESLDGTRASWDIEGVCTRLRPCAS